MATPPQVHHIVNFRDLGGATTADGRRVALGRIYRSGHLGAASDEDLRELERVGLRTVIDLRGPTDIAVEGTDRLPTGARLVAIPMFEPGGDDIRALFDAGDAGRFATYFGDGRAVEIMRAAAVTLVTDPKRCLEFAAMLEHLAASDGTPALIHCSAGKDRTGWAASLILTMLGVDEDQVVAHYLESNHHRSPENAARIARWDETGVDWSMVAPLFGVHEDYARAALRAIDEHWGGLDEYLYAGLGVRPEVVERLRVALLADELASA